LLIFIVVSLATDCWRKAIGIGRKHWSGARSIGRRIVNFLLRSILLTLCLAPYLYFGIRDVLHHQQHRKVTFTERLLHVTLGGKR